MISRALVAMVVLSTIPVVAPVHSSSSTCFATAASLTPASWRMPTPSAQKAPTSALKLAREVPLPGPASRFDYQAIDPSTRRLFMNHMNAGRTIVFDTDSDRVVTEIRDVARATGIRVIPPHSQIYISAAGSHEVVIVDERTLEVKSRVGGIHFPDGIAYASHADKVFVSDEAGEAEVVIDAKTGLKRATIPLGGEAGNTQYDSVSHCILVAVQTRNQLVAIDPVSEQIVQRYDLPGSDHPHGFALDEPDRLAFVTSEENAALQVVDLRTMRVIATHHVGDGPDVVAWDPVWRRLYVASEGGVLSIFWLNGRTLQPLGEIRAPHAHTVAVDPQTHRVYLPLENIRGRPVLRIYEAVPR